MQIANLLARSNFYAIQLSDFRLKVRCREYHPAVFETYSVHVH